VNKSRVSTEQTARVLKPPLFALCLAAAFGNTHGQERTPIDPLPTGQIGTGAWQRQFTGSVRPEWFGAKCDGLADDTTPFQAAVAYVTATHAKSSSIELSACTLRLTRPITVTSGLRITGQGVSPYDGALGTVGNGSWLFFDHPGVGIRTEGDRPISGLVFEKLGTRRDQPPPTMNWAPRPYDFDFVISNADTMFLDVTLLNPTKGIKADKGHYGRLTIERLRGQPLQVGVEVSESYDTFTAHDVHFWPFWRDDPNIRAYTLQHLDAFWLYRADNPMMSDVFTIFARAGIRFSQNAFGKVSKLHLVNADFDRGLWGLWIDPSVTDGVTGQADNVTIQGETGVPLTIGIFCLGSGGRMSFGNLSIAVSDRNAIRIEGSRNDYRITNLEITGYDLSAAGFPAVEALGGNSILIADVPLISGGKSGPIYGGAGTIRAKLAEGKTETTTNKDGDIVVEHAAGITPSAVFVQQATALPLHWSVVSVTNTNFTVRTYNSNGTPLSDSRVIYYWFAER